MKKENKIIVILGKKGSGKTTLAQKIMTENLHNYKWCFVWDFVGEYNYFCISWTIQDLIKNIELGHFSIRWQINEFDLLCKIIKLIKNCLFIIEDADAICSPTYISSDFADIIRYGRHWNIDLIFTSRRPYSLNRLITSQADEIYVFKFIEPRDLEYLEKITFNKEKIMNLKDFEYVKKA